MIYQEQECSLDMLQWTRRELLYQAAASKRESAAGGCRGMGRRWIAVALFLLGWVATASCSSSCSSADSEALLSLRANDSSSAGLATWQRGSDCCNNWLGVTCATDESGAAVVTELQLAGFSEVLILLSPSVCKLEKLEVLSLTNNATRGFIPPCLWNMSSLQILDLSTTGAIFQSPLADQVGSADVVLATNLQNLQLTSVELSGPLPQWLGNLSQLQTLDLSGNRITSVPSSLGQLKSLNTLKLSDNFIPEIPPSLGALSNLTKLDFSVNNISVIPTSVQNLSRLTELNLNGNLLQSAPSFLGEMSALTTLWLAGNSIVDVPQSLGDLSNLLDLDLSLNKIESFHLPATSNLSSLQSLDLDSNNLQKFQLGCNLSSLSFLSMAKNKLESFDAALGTRYEFLSELYHLDLSSNDLQGEIPVELGQLPYLKTLSLSGNNLSGSIPETFETIDSLALDRNSLAGPIPAFVREVARPMDGTSLNLSHNALTGAIPESICRSYYYVDLSYNNLTGPLPLTALEGFTLTLVLSHNRIEGGIPWAWKNRTSDSDGFLPLEVLDMSSNRLSGSVPAFLGDLLALVLLDLSNNQLTGAVQGKLGEMSSLQGLKLGSNLLGGEIPPALGTIGTSLIILSLRDNNLHGPIPLSLGNFTSLQLLDLSRNQLSGPLSSNLQTLNATLRVLSVSSNNLTGGFPIWITSFVVLQVLDLSRNRFEGLIPKNYSQLGGFMVKEDGTSSKSKSTSATLYDESITLSAKGGSLELSYVLSVTTYFGVADNALHGPIPEHLADLLGLAYLTLAGNNFTGSIPESLDNLSQLQSLDLSRNQLDGTIPLGFAQLTFLSYLNVSDNKLQGSIPVGGQLQTFSPDDFGGNAGLCGSPLPKCNGTSAAPSPFAATRQVGTRTNYVLEEWISPVALAIGAVLGFLGVTSTFIVSEKAWHLIYKLKKPVYKQVPYGAYIPPR